VRQHALEQYGHEVFRRAREHLQQVSQRLETALEATLKTASEKLIRHTATLKAVDPTAVLNRGYALVTDANGHLVTQADTVAPGDTLSIRLAKGTLTATATPHKP
jgi:exodeoxyribonuclease VII large subunit